jgi:arginine exporter protein ArgO
MENKNQKNKKMFFLAGALLAAPAVYWFMMEGWTPETSKVKVLMMGVQAIFGIYLFYYGVSITKKLK